MCRLFPPSTPSSNINGQHRHEGRYRVIDRGSRNGTFVNGQRITEIDLNDGDLIRLGEMGDNAVTLTFRSGQAPQATSIDQFDLAAYDVLTDWPRPRLRSHPGFAAGFASPRPAGTIRHDAPPDRSGQHQRHVREQPPDRSGGAARRVTSFRSGRIASPINRARSARSSRPSADDWMRCTSRAASTGGHLILNDVSLSIAPREFVAIVGGSGSGKTTLLNALSGFQPAEGRLLFNGDDYYANFDLYRNLIGYVPQDDIIHHDLPVGQALRYAALLRLPGDTSDAEIDARIERVLAEVDMDAQSEQIVGRLSGGQRKRVSISMELLAEPGVFFLDEATSGLDPGLGKEIDVHAAASGRWRPHGGAGHACHGEHQAMRSRRVHRRGPLGLLRPAG